VNGSKFKRFETKEPHMSIEKKSLISALKTTKKANVATSGETVTSEKNLSSKNLSHKNLSAKNLSHKNLSAKNLSQKNLSAKNLSHKNLSQKNLSHKTLGK
jgi:uncharacterized protein YjbI with pentapeptide repeats